MASSDQTINLPQLILILVLGGLAIRYFFSSNSPSTGNRGATSANNVRAREADVERIQQMFPQVSRRNIMWDLQRNGGNVVATTERILSGRGLEVPPQSFQPPLPSTTSSTTSTTTPKPARPLQPDLITRYNLGSKINNPPITTDEEEAEREKEEKKPQVQNSSWSANKGERQALLQRRREEMILAARRKMEAKVAAEASLGKQGI
ncbi:Coupling of ubiquitin conjugation to ER degradation protein [Lachnellula hyalina]|uniref:Coupling of ubiquitin conjugation to ER degradation protein 1 n=1 Tax=Lachnellula hyalina TaxID=1316788 RepID=A0A8H8R6J1_9HELO|nr:Coupling of ubiquitin conjugation to ER degradation protein [Lachnellula hyalina]TVY29508.1 Coupling of ubiquitin conjugation to ER degradation protein [Lachnellula hyalina]